jgi:hypothetical protein
MGTRAFVSSVQAYAKHDCHVVCNVKGRRATQVCSTLFSRVVHTDLDVVGCAHDYALLRLPKMPELSNRDLSGFQVCINARETCENVCANHLAHDNNKHG